MRFTKISLISALLLCLGQVQLVFPYGNLQFKDDHNNTVNSLWDGRSYDSTLFPDGIPWLLNDWDPNEIFDFNLSTFQEIVNDAFETWEQVPDANMAFVYDGLTANGTDGYGGTHSLPPHPALDGDNVILFDDLGTGVLGLTCIFTLSEEFTFNDSDADPNNDTNFGGPDPNSQIMEGTYPAGTILDSDIILNKNFSDYSIAGERGKYDLQAVLVHEIGHFVGLCHSCVRETPESEATMFPFANSNPLGLAKRTLAADDKSGVSFYYPSPSFATNLGSISGTVTRGGSPQCGPHVYAIKSDDRSVIVGTYSDESGNYSLQGLPPGDYILRIEPLCIYKERINEIVESQSGIMLYNFMAQIHDNVSLETAATLISVNAGADSSGKDFYLISPQDDTFENDDTIATAHLLEADGCRELHHMIYNHDPDYYRDIDYFKFHLDAGMLYRIFTNNITLESEINSSEFHNSDTTLWLYDVDAKTPIRSNDDSARELLESLIYFIPEHSGIYYLSVSHAGYPGPDPKPDNWPGAGGNYDISITPIHPQEYFVSETTGLDPSVFSGNTEPFAFSEGDNLTVSVDGLNEQEILFSSAESTASEVVTAIKGQTNNIDAYVTVKDDLKYVRLVSQRGGLLTSPQASIQVTGGTANSVLAFPIIIQNSGDGTSSAPWKSIQYAISSVEGTYLEPVMIRAASGTYYENIETDGYDFIFGGYDPNHWTPENSPCTTEINGMGLGTTLHLQGHTILNNVGVTGGLGKRGELFNGERSYAGGINCQDSPTILFCRIFENNAGYSNPKGPCGGGVFFYFWNGGPQLIGNQITENFADGNGEGGGIYIFGIPNSCMIRDNYIVNNSARFGAGLHNATYGGAIYVSSNIIAGNSGLAGAGIMSDGKMVIKDNALVCNDGSGYSARNGGTILEGNVIASNNIGIYGYNMDRTKHINNWIVGNQADERSQYNGGGVYHDYGSRDSVYYGNIIVGNYAKNYGGGVYWGETSGGGRFIANTIAHNSSEIDAGGGLYSYKTDGSLISNNIFAYNNGSGVYEGLEGDVTTQHNAFFGNSINGYYDHDTATGYSTADEINTLVDNGSYPVDNNVDWIPRFKPAPNGTAESITYDPTTFQSILIDNDAMFDPNALARLTINPDPNQPLHFYIISNTETSITTWGDMTSVATTPYRYKVFDYHLLKDSRNIHAGMDVSAYTTTDIDGQTRPLYRKFDIGADEVFPIAGDFEPDEDVDVVDFNFWTNYWLNPCTPPDWCQDCDIDKNGIVDVIDYAKIAAHWLYGTAN